MEKQVLDRTRGSSGIDVKIVRRPGVARTKLCTHGNAKLVAKAVLWCQTCGAIAMIDGGLVDPQRPLTPPPGSSAFLRPDREKP